MSYCVCAISATNPADEEVKQVQAAQEQAENNQENEETKGEEGKCVEACGIPRSPTYPMSCQCYQLSVRCLSVWVRGERSVDAGRRPLWMIDVDFARWFLQERKLKNVSKRTGKWKLISLTTWA